MTNTNARRVLEEAIQTSQNILASFATQAQEIERIQADINQKREANAAKRKEHEDAIAEYQSALEAITPAEEQSNE